MDKCGYKFTIHVYETRFIYRKYIDKKFPSNIRKVYSAPIYRSYNEAYLASISMVNIWRLQGYYPKVFINKVRF